MGSAALDKGADSGWEQGAVTALVDRFFVDSELLAKRLALIPCPRGA